MEDTGDAARRDSVGADESISGSARTGSSERRSGAGSESTSHLPPAVEGAPGGSARRTILRVGGAVAAAVGGMATGVAACSRQGAATAPPPTVSVVPANGATDIDPSKPISVQVRGGEITSVQLSGRQTDGTLSTDRRSWIFHGPLSVDSEYLVTVNAVNALGVATTQTVSFRTLTPSATLGVSSVTPPHGSTVGVGQPIRVTFTGYVPAEYKAALEKTCVVTTDPPFTGAWYWVSNDPTGAIVDWRPEGYWPTGTQVSIAFNLDGVRLGVHQYGAEDYPAHTFTISDRDLRLTIDKDRFRATCTENGQVIRTFPISTGITSAETFVTYTGTMAVLGKGNPVEMKGNYGPGDTYDDFVDWATQITWSGTYVHAAPWDPDIGYANVDSHGCIHCHPADAEWFYRKVITGDVVTITGSPARPVAVADGICTFTLDWPTLLAGSAYGATRNGTPATTHTTSR